jgi:hypothetical protein
LKKLLVWGDTHAGSEEGWTHESYHRRSRNPKVHRQANKQVKAWLEEYGPFDSAVHMGDTIDGSQYKSKGTGLITSDMYEQIEMAGRLTETIRMYGKRRGFKMAAVTGTCYHVDVEGTSAERYMKDQGYFDIVDDRLLLDVGGCSMDFRHKIGNSSIPNGDTSAARKEAAWNALLENAGCQDHADVVVRGHVHKITESFSPDLGHAFTSPALQLKGGKFGKQMCNGWYHFGILVLYVDGGKLIGYDAPHWAKTPQDLRRQDFC